MSGLFDKAKELIPSDTAEKVADAVEENLTADKVDSVLGKVGGGALADKIPDDINETVSDAIRDNLGNKKE